MTIDLSILEFGIDKTERIYWLNLLSVGSYEQTRCLFGFQYSERFGTYLGLLFFHVIKL